MWHVEKLSYVANRPGKKLTVTVKISPDGAAEVRVTDTATTTRGKHVKADKSDK